MPHDRPAVTSRPLRHAVLRPVAGMRAALAALALLVMLVLLVAPSARAQGSAAEQEVLGVVRRLFDGMRAGDSSMVRAVFHPKARLISSGTGRDGKARLNVEASADNFVRAVGTPHPAVWDERFWNEKVQIDGDVASVWVDYSFFAGDTFSHCGIDHFLLVKGDGGAWTILELADTRRTTGCVTTKR